MSPLSVALVFAVVLVAALLTRVWLASRQIRHVAAHRSAVPPPFAATVTLQAHQRAADYTLAKGQFGIVSTAFATALLLGWTWLGGLDALNAVLVGAIAPRWGGLAYQIALVAAFALIGGVLGLPFSIYQTFGIEQRFGFNRTTWRLFVADIAKGVAVAVLLGLPLLALVLWLMGAAGRLWWLWAWGAWTAFNLALMVIYPTVIAPLFNRFRPLADDALAERVRTLMQRCGFAAKGLFVMDGSRRSAHGNAYFTGLGAAKRVVVYDTLLAKLSAGEVEAVLAHELGHFKRRHVTKRMAAIAAASLAALALLGWLAAQPALYLGLGVTPNLDAPNDALALLLFMLVVPEFGFFVSPLAALWSRRHEFEADAYACAHADGAALASALLKLHEDNAATLTPDPLYVRFYYTHPPAGERLAALPAR